MANKSISQLTAGSAVSGTDLFPDVQTAGVGPVKVTATQLATYFWNSPTLVTPSLGAATASSIAIAGATLGTNVLAVNGTTLLGGATTVSTGGLTIGVAGTTGGTIALKGSTAGTLTLQVPATVTDYSITLPSAAAAANGYILTSTTAGVTSWTNPTALGVDLDVGSTAITGGVTGRVLYDNAGVLGEYTAVPVGFGGTGTSTAFTTGSVVFAGASGVYSQDNANFFWDNTNSRLGLGTTTTATRLNVVDSANTYAATFTGTSSTNFVALGTTAFGASIAGWTAGFAASADLVLQPNGGNLGLGVTPSAWSAYRALQIASTGGALSSSSSSDLEITTNTYNAGAGWLSQGAGVASSRYRLYAGTHVWYTAPSSTAGSAISFTQAMTLDAAGSLTIATSGARIYGDYSNATATNRLSFQTSTTNGQTGIYILPNGTSASASLQASNNADPTNASKLIVGAASTEMQIASGINGTGTYLPLSIYTSGGQSAQFSTTKGTFTLGVAGTATGILNLTGATSGTTAITVPAVAGSYTWTIPNSGAAATFGYLNIPQNAQTSAYVAAIGDVGKHISITTGGVTVNASIFSAGDVFTIYNNSGSSQNITAGSGVTFRLAGTATSGTPRTVAQYGLATVLCVTGGASPVFVLSGAGVA